MASVRSLRELDLRGFDFHLGHDQAGVDAHGCWWVVRPAKNVAALLFEVRYQRYGQHGVRPWPWDRQTNASRYWARFEEAVEALAAHLAWLSLGEGI